MEKEIIINEDLLKTNKVFKISSQQNPTYKSFLSLLKGNKSSLGLMSGLKIVSEMCDLFSEKIEALIITDSDDLNKLKIKIPSGLKIYILNKELFNDLDIFGTKAPLLLVKSLEIKFWDNILSKGATVFLPFQDPANLGTSIRTAAAMGAKVVILEEGANVGHPKTLRAAGPAVYQTEIFAGPSINDLADSQEALWALDFAGENIINFKFPEKFGLVFGLEGPGLGDKWVSKNSLTIPMKGKVESLNAAASLAMALYAWRASLKD